MQIIAVTTWTLGMLAQFSVRQRWQAAGNWPAWTETPLFGAFIAILIVALIAVVVGIIHTARNKKIQSIANKFRSQGHELGLNDEEVSLLASIAVKVMRDDPYAVFSSQELFSKGLAQLVESDRLEDTFSQSHHFACPNCPFIVSLREKLGYSIMPGLAKPSNIQLGPIPRGEIFDIERSRSPESFRVRMIRMESNPTQLWVQPLQDIRSRPGETWTVRFPRGGVLWEFNVWVVKHDRGEVLIRPVGQVRWINRRRFPRVETQKAIWSASFPFDRGNLIKDSGPEFIEGMLVEIAGPGLLIKSDLHVKVSDRVLIVMQLENDRIFESSGTVKRIDEEKGFFAVELTGLTTAEVAELARQTNRAAREGLNREQADMAIAVQEGE